MVFPKPDWKPHRSFQGVEMEPQAHAELDIKAVDECLWPHP